MKTEILLTEVTGEALRCVEDESHCCTTVADRRKKKLGFVNSSMGPTTTAA